MTRRSQEAANRQRALLRLHGSRDAPGATDQEFHGQKKKEGFMLYVNPFKKEEEPIALGDFNQYALAVIADWLCAELLCNRGGSHSRPEHEERLSSALDELGEAIRAMASAEEVE